MALTLAGGVLANRADRRRVFTGFQSVQMLCPILIVALLLAGAVQPWMTIMLSRVVAITDALSMPSFSSIIASIVERAQIGAGLALNSTQFKFSRIARPVWEQVRDDVGRGQRESDVDMVLLRNRL